VTGVSSAVSHAASPVAVDVATTSTGAGTGAIGINFVGGSPTPMAATETAGVVSQSHWNNATGSSRSTKLALIDATGAATAASVTWTANSVWTTPIADQAGNARLMRGYLDSTSTSTTTVTVTGLAQRTYDVYVYADGANAAASRTAAYTISGTGITSSTITLTDAANANFAGSFTRGSGSSGNYVKFTISATGFTLSASPAAASSTTRRAPVNAIQIVPAAPPAPAPAIGVNFVGGGATLMAAAETAGVVSKSHWNNASGDSSGTPLPLVNDAGAATAATITWTSAGVWQTPVVDQAGNRRMMQGYLDTTSTSTTTIAVSGLAQGNYDVYVYADGDNRGYARTAAYTISGPGITATTIRLTDAANATFSTAFTQAASSNGNYVKFKISATGFTLTATPVSGTNATLRAPVNGIQIVPR
jgi:hypothetical protein